MDELENPTPPETLSVTDAVRQSLAQDTPSEPTPAPPAPAVEAAPPEEKPWEAPSWAARWKPEARDALGRFASHGEFKPHFDVLQKQLEEINGYTTRRDQEYSEYRKHFDPIYDTLRPYEQRYALQGMSLQQGVQQLFQSAEYLASAPDEAFPWLASTYKPSNPAQTLTALAHSWGVDLNALDTPYIDPSVTALLSPLQQQVQTLQQQLQQQQATSTRSAQTQLLHEIDTFEQQKDEHGNLAHPYFRDVFDDMMMAVNMGYAKDIPSAYDVAIRVNPQVRQRLQDELVEKARAKAVEEAQARTAAAEKVAQASRTVVGKSSAAQTGTASLREAYDRAMATLST